MAEHARRLSEAGTVLRNYTDEELTSLVVTDTLATDLERELASRLLDHKDHRRMCTECGGKNV